MTRAIRTGDVPTLRLRTEEDILALIPYTFGFHPQQSLVLVVLDAGGRPMQARIDLPPASEPLCAVVDGLVEPVLHHLGNTRSGPRRHQRAFVLLYADDRAQAEEAVGLVEDQLAEARVRIVLALRVEQGRWFPLGRVRRGDEAAAEHGVPFDLTSHELTARAVLEGGVTFASRAELAASLEPVDTVRLAAVRTALTVQGPLPKARPALVAEGRWLVETLEAGVAQAAGLVDAPDPPRGLDAVVVARLLRALDHPDLRDLTWCRVDHHDAPQHVRWWREIVTSSPDPQAASAAAVLGFTAWLSGDGALAWCAVERSLRARPGHSLARLVADSLDQALPPYAWSPADPTILPLFEALPPRLPDTG